MKRNDIKGLHQKTLQELEVMITDARNELLDLGLAKAQNKLKNTRSIFFKKKDVARMLTIKKGKELEAKKGKS